MVISLRVVPSYTSIRDPLRRLCHRLIVLSISGKGQAPEKVTVTDLFYLRSMDEGTTFNVPYLLAQYFFRHTKGRKRRASKSGGHFVRRLAEYFSLVTDEGLIGLTVIAHELPVIDIDELVRLRIYDRLGDTWAWVAPIQEKEPVPQPRPAAAPTRTMPQKMARLEEEVHRLSESLGEQHEVLDAMSQDISRFTTWTVGSLS
nr:hypothetical protein [Tanacetum cinerariifolium]